MSADLISEVERLELAINYFLKEATKPDDPGRPVTYEVLFLVLDAFGAHPIGQEDADAEAALPSLIQQKLPALRSAAQRVTDVLQGLLIPAPTYCAASYWDAPRQRRHVVSRRRTVPQDLTLVLRSAYCFYVLTHRGYESSSSLLTAVQLISKTKTVIRLAYDSSPEDSLPQSIFRLTKEQCDGIVAATRLDALVAKVLPDLRSSAMAIHVAGQMRNEYKLSEAEEQPIAEYLEVFPKLNFTRYAALLNKFGHYLLMRRPWFQHDLDHSQLMFILATSILYNRYVCPAKYLYPTLVPVAEDFAILTVGTDEPLPEPAQMVIRSFARSLFQGLLVVDREHVHALANLRSLLERTAAQVHHNIRDPLGRASSDLAQLSRLLDEESTERRLAKLAGLRISFAALQVEIFSAAFDATGKYRSEFVAKGRRSIAFDGATDLPALLRTVIEVLRGRPDEFEPTVAEACRLDVGEMPRQACWVKGQRAWWALVLHVLLKNAMEAASAGGLVRVTFRESKPGEWKLDITNHVGGGMSDDVLQRMQAVLRHDDNAMDFGYMGLATAGDALTELRIDPRSVEVGSNTHEQTVTVTLTGIPAAV